MNVLRSSVFYIVFFGWTLFFTLIFFPLLILPRRLIVGVPVMWSHGAIWMCEKILGLHMKVIGEKGFPNTPFILAVKHQSAWETLVFFSLVSNLSIVLKKELTWIPLFGWYLIKLRMVSLSRSKGRRVQDLRNLLKEAGDAVGRNQSILIFPEGTRSQVGQKGEYHSGVGSLYTYLNIPVIPIAHNAGLFWPRRGFIKTPGCITLEVLDPIQPGLSRKDFMDLLENKIETKTNELVQKGLAHAAKS